MTITEMSDNFCLKVFSSDFFCLIVLSSGFVSVACFQSQWLYSQLLFELMLIPFPAQLSCQ